MANKHPPHALAGLFRAAVHPFPAPARATDTSCDHRNPSDHCCAEEHTLPWGYCWPYRSPILVASVRMRENPADKDEVKVSRLSL